MKQSVKEKLEAFATDLENKGLPDEAKTLRDIVSSEETNEDENTEDTGGSQPPPDKGRD